MNQFARNLAAVLLDGAWERRAMQERLRCAVRSDLVMLRGLVARAPQLAPHLRTPSPQAAPWMKRLSRAAASRPRDDVDGLAAWIATRDEVLEAWRLGARVFRLALPAPEMRESPWGVPALATPHELAMWLGVDDNALTRLADRGGIMGHYRSAWLRKASGGYRLVEAPRFELRVLQRRLLDGILAAIPPHAAAHGFRRGGSIAGFARPHVGREVVIRVDLEAFFSSVFRARVLGILRTAGYPGEVARTLAALCTHRTPEAVLARAPVREPVQLARLRSAHLPQGAPTSGALANLAAYRLDVRVAALAARWDATYTRYADDLVISGGRNLVHRAAQVVGAIGAIAADEGFQLNYRKTRVMTAANSQRIAGVVVNDKLSISRRDVDALRAILFNCARTGPATQNRDNHADFRAHLRGRVAWVESIDAAKGARLRALFERIAW